MLVPLELARIIICEFNQHQVLFLKEKGGVREFPIVIGLFEATTIDRKLRHLMSERPLTHDLFTNLILALDGELLDMVIYKAQGEAFFAHLRIKIANRLILLDARPSDAVAICLGSTPARPIFVQKEVFEQVAKP